MIPDELRAVIEFLNARMHDTEVFGVEVRRYGSAETQELAAAADKKQQTSLDEKLRAAPPEVNDAAERLRFLAAELGLVVREVAASLRIRDLIGTVVLLYPTYRTMEFPLDPLLGAGKHDDAAKVREALQRIAGDTRKVSPKSPNIGCPEALARWDEVAEVIRVLVRVRSERTSLPAK